MTKRQKRDAIAAHKLELAKRKEIEEKRLRVVPYVAPSAAEPAKNDDAQVVAPVLSFWPHDECVLPPPMPIVACSTVHREQLDPQLRDPVLELAMVARLVPRKENLSGIVCAPIPLGMRRHLGNGLRLRKRHDNKIKRSTLPV